MQKHKQRQRQKQEDHCILVLSFWGLASTIAIVFGLLHFSTTLATTDHHHHVTTEEDEMVISTSATTTTTLFSESHVMTTLGKSPDVAASTATTSRSYDFPRRRLNLFSQPQEEKNQGSSATTIAHNIINTRYTTSDTTATSGTPAGVVGPKNSLWTFPSRSSVNTITSPSPSPSPSPSNGEQEEIHAVQSHFYLRHGTNYYSKQSNQDKEQEQDDDNDINDDSSSTPPNTDDSPTHMIPAIMIGLSSAIIFCAVFLYCADLRDRWDYQKWIKHEHSQQQHQDIQDDQSSDRSGEVTEDDQDENDQDFFIGRDCGRRHCHHRHHHDGASGSVGTIDEGYWVQTMMQELVKRGNTNYNPPPNILPPTIDDDEREAWQLDDVSISRVSTLTASIMEGSYCYYNNTDDNEQNIHNTEVTIETRNKTSTFCNNDKVTSTAATIDHDDDDNHDDDNDDVDHGDISICSSLTEGSLQRKAMETLGHIVMSQDLDEPPPTTTATNNNHDYIDVKQSQRRQDEEETRDDLEDGMSHDMLKLERIIAGIPQGDDDGGSDKSFAHLVAAPREVHFYGGGGKQKQLQQYHHQSRSIHGLELLDATSPTSHPVVKRVDVTSAFIGRVFVSDLVLRVNQVDLTGKKAVEVWNIIMSSSSPPPQGSQSEEDPTKPARDDDDDVVNGKFMTLTVVSENQNNGTPPPCIIDYGSEDGRQSI